MVHPRRRQTQTTESTIRGIHHSPCRSYNRARIHSTRPSDIHQRMGRSRDPYVLLQPGMHSMGTPARTILAHQPRNTKTNGHMHLSRPNTTAPNTNVLPIHANGVNTPRNLFQIKRVTGNNANVIIIHA